MESHSLETEGEILHKSPMIHGKEQLRHGHKPPILLPVSTSSHSPETSLSPIDTMNSLSNFESEIDHDGQGNYSLFPALDNVTILSGTSEALESEPTTDVSDKPNMTWLDAAQIVLEEAGRPLHIKEIKQRILDRGLVQSNSKSSLEAVLYRETQKGSRRFKRLENRNGVFALLENAALCDEIAYIEQKFIQTKEERRFLLKRLLQHQNLTEGADLAGPTSGVLTSPMYNVPGGTNQVPGVSNLPTTPVTSTSVGEEALGKKSKKDKRDKEKDNGKDDGMRKVSKKKRTRDRSTRKPIQPIPLDSCGRPIFPIVLGGLTIYSLGEIIADRSGFCDETAIYPVGFCSTRVYASMKNPNHKCLYTCQIKDGGSGPQFEITPEVDPQNALVATSASACHASLLKAIAMARGKPFINVLPSGADFFGFSHPTIQNLIQSCPGARKCVCYRWVRFEVCRPGDGQVPRGLPEDDASMNFEALRQQVFEEGVNNQPISEQASSDEEDGIPIGSRCKPRVPALMPTHELQSADTPALGLHTSGSSSLQLAPALQPSPSHTPGTHQSLHSSSTLSEPILRGTSSLDLSRSLASQLPVLAWIPPPQITSSQQHRSAFTSPKLAE
ncbi:transforming growth factor beta regulator 1 isoform X6 [Carcharodon carcharias]|uniref:transforming growth factor beta regulator 1 isoform X6 n=1 Tax=Carcharodon carcharias TaxID=13397 RepID=UPI001B7DC274|nr:transforming growth factor beta regulator 1 isoform X6 [Carcharodon carcharias]